MTDDPRDDLLQESPPEDAPRTQVRTSSHWTLQVQLLTRAIEASPDVPVNYLLRGEEWLICGDLKRARADFENARSLSEDLLRQSAWGYIYQAYIDRAEIGLRQCGNNELSHS